MKKLVWIMALLLCLGCTACNSSVETSPIEDTQESVETISQEEETTVPVVEEVDATVLDFQEIALSLNNATSLDTSALYYTENKQENTLPAVVEFWEPYISYEYLDTSAADEIAGQYSGAFQFGRYSLETGETIEFPMEDMHSGGYPVVANQDCALYLYPSSDEDGNSVMKIVRFDFAENVQQVIGMYPAYYAVGEVKKLSDNTVVFFLYNAVEKGTQQLLLSYDLETDELQDIYRGEITETMHDTGIPSIYAMDTYGDNIYLLMQQYIEDRMQSSLCVLDATGAVIEEVELDMLQSDTVDDWMVCNDLLFVHFASNDRTEILQKTDDGYNLLDLQDTTPGSCIGKSESYVYFRDSETDNTIYAVNSETGEAYAITLPWEEVTSVIVDASGNILVAVREDDSDQWVLIPAEDVHPTK